MGSSYGLEGKGVDLSQGPPKGKRIVVRIPDVIETPKGKRDVVAIPAVIEKPKRKRDVVRIPAVTEIPERKRDVVRIPAVIETPLVPTENAPSSFGCHSDVVLLLDLIMSFLCTVFSWAFLSYMLKFDLFIYFLILFGCRQFFLTLKTMIAYCPHKASGEGSLVQI